MSLAVVLAGVLLLGAETAPATISLTLAEAIERARTASAGLAQLDALERAAAADQRGALALRLPQVDVTAGYTRQSDVPELTLTFPGQAPRTIFPNIPDNYRSRVSAGVPLYTGGRLAAMAEAARREHAAAGLDRKTADADLVLETISAYWSLVTAREAAHVLDEAMASYDAHLNDARNRERFGLSARNEVLLVGVERDRAELGRLRTENAAALAEANLQRLLGLPAGTRLEPGDALDGAPAEGPALEARVADALAHRAERAALAERVAAADARVRVERAARLPQAALAAGFDYANPNRRILPPEAAWNDTWDVSANVTWTVFDGGRVRAASDRSAARAQALRLQLEDFDRRVRLQVTQRHLDLAAARRAVEVTERGMAAARESSRVTGERYRAGVATSSERLDAEVVALRAALDHKEARAELRMAAAALDRAVGR